MRVLLASFDNPATLRGGVEAYTCHLARALGEEGAEVRVATRRPAGAVPEDVADVPFAWVDVPGPWGQPTHRHRMVVDRIFDRGVRRHAAWADVVHGQNLDGRGALGLRPVVATVHTTPLDEWGSSRLGGWREATYQRWAHGRRVAAWRRGLPRHDHVWCVGERIAESARSLGVAAPEVVPNPVPPLPHGEPDLLRGRLGLPDGPVVLSLGRLARVKGVHRLIEAVAGMPEWTLLVAGDGPERQALARQARPVGDRVRFLGRVSEPQKAALLHLVDVFCLPSEHEGQPLAILEAMAVGLPVVATDPAWVPADLRRYGHWGRDLPRLLEEARRRGRHEGASVPSYRDLARRSLDTYSSLA